MGAVPWALRNDGYRGERTRCASETGEDEVMQNTIIGQLEAEQMGKNVPDFAPGDTVVVDVRVVEGERQPAVPGAG